MVATVPEGSPCRAWGKLLRGGNQAVQLHSSPSPAFDSGHLGCSTLPRSRHTCAGQDWQYMFGPLAGLGTHRVSLNWDIR